MASETIGRRFSKLIQHLGISKNAFAQSLDKTATVIQHLVDERNKPGYDLLCKVFEVYPQVSKDWLLLGQGPMLVALPAAGSSAVAPVPEAASPAAENPLLTSSRQPSPAPVAESKSAEVSAPLISAPTDSAPAKAEPATITATPDSGTAASVVTAALHAQHLQHQLAMAEQRNQHLLAQQQLLHQMLELAQRR